MAIETALVQGLAGMLLAASIGSWSTSTPYTSGNVGIYDGPVGADTIEGVGISTYPVADAVDSRSVIGVQFIIRSATKAALRDRAEAIFGVCQSLWGRALTGVRIGQMLRQSSADLGMDENGAFLRTDNYYVTVNHPTANRP